LNNLENIQVKLHQFIRKFYINELIKGLLLFFTIGLLYFIFTLLIEHFLWLKPVARTLLFWLFIIVECTLLIFYILIPIFKIGGFKNGISEFEASDIIGKYFPEVSDKLLNMLQLKQIQQNSELIEASIEQKSKELQGISFVRAIDFTKNKKYIKYAIIPVFVWLLVYITGNSIIFNDSFSRIVHYKTQYEPPAPFSFQIINDNLNAIEGKPFLLKVEVIGNIIPDDAKIYFSNENYYLEKKGFGFFEYNFTNLNSPLKFYIEANGVRSKDYEINVIATPVITNLKMILKYPEYTGKKNEVIQNTGNAIIPAGTKVFWHIETNKTNVINFKSINEVNSFTQNSKDLFSYSKQINESINYKIATSNSKLKNYESLNFDLEVIRDEFPKIVVQSNIDSIARGPVYFIGQLSDDYCVNKLQLVYYNKNNPKQSKTHLIEVSKSSFTDFYYIFPNDIEIEEGIEYELFFEVFDNDAVNGSKRTKSKTFSYYVKTNEELNNELLKEQNESINTFSKDLERKKNQDKSLKKFSEELQRKADINWNDSKKLEEFLNRQMQYENMFKENTKQLENNLNEQPKIKSLKEKKEELQKRIEEVNKMTEQEKMLEELKQLSEKLEKEDLVQKLKELTKKNKQNEQSLERILELTKRFYVEQKMNQISQKLDKLATKEEQLSKETNEENTSKKQDEINKEFNEINKDFNELNKQNIDLKRPMKLPESSQERKEIDSELNKALDDLKSKDQEGAKKSQKSAAKKMKTLSKEMEQSMEDMEGESIDENIDDLRKIVENLIEFSFKQEALMNKFSAINNNHPNFPKNLKQQQILKEYFEHIDDSLYVLSLRLVSMGSKIQKDVSDVHFNMDESLSNFSDNFIDQAISNQHFVITGANNLANALSDLLEGLINASPSMGNGKGNSQDFSLPDIIKKQGQIMNEIEEGLKNGDEGKEKRNSNENGEQSNEELYEIYKKQSQLKDALKDILVNESNKSRSMQLNNAIKKMDELEKELLEKGISNSILKKIEQLDYELLKLNNAKKQQGDDTERKSESSRFDFDPRIIDKLKLQNQYFNYNEILNRQSLPLRTIYKKRVQEYFKTED